MYQQFPYHKSIYGIPVAQSEHIQQVVHPDRHLESEHLMLISEKIGKQKMTEIFTSKLKIPLFLKLVF